MLVELLPAFSMLLLTYPRLPGIIKYPVDFTHAPCRKFQELPKEKITN